jgi:alpha-mannosidase/mannosylglycerate hydrolase
MDAMEFLHPARSLTLPLTAPSFEGNRPIIASEPPLPASASLLSLGPDTMILSAVKKAEDRDSLIVRAWNIGTKPVKAEFNFGREVRQAYSVNLAEKRLKRIAVKNGNVITIPCRPKQITSIEILSNGGYFGDNRTQRK